MDENELIPFDGENGTEPICEFVPEMPLPDLSETTRYTDEYLAFLASLESSSNVNNENSDNE